jgi:hypothetical protein
MEDDLELTIDEPTDGHFYWVISTRTTTKAGAPSVIDFAKGPLPKHQAALDAGLVALRCHRSLKRDADAPYSEFRADWYADTVPAALL